jgi:hypothetical protein
MRKFISIISMGLVLGAVSCTKQEVSQEQGVGMLSMDMSVAAQTRALSEDELYNTAKVNIYKADYSGLVRSYAYSEIPSPLYLAADKYRVDVIAGEAVAQTPAIASWDSKSYKGSKAFEIVANQVTTVQVVANINNAVTKVAFDPTVAENFNAGYTLTMTLSDEAASSLVYDASKSGAEGYYIVADLFEPSLTWTFTGTLAKDGSTFTKTGVIENVQPGKLYSMNLKYTIKDGDLVFSLSVDRTTEIVDDTIIFEPVSTGLSASSIYEIWATRATLHADVDAAESEGKAVQFAYSTDGGSTWSYADGINDSEGTWKAELNGLAPATTYTYALMIGGEQVGEPMTFQTEEAPNLPNASFEYVSKVSGKDYYKFYDPNCGVAEGSYMFWGSGNGEGAEGVNGSANMGIVITTIDTSDKIHGNQSVVAQTSSMAGMLAAGNLFTGQFAGLVGTSGGKVNFGRPWTSRPSAMRIWCKYETGAMNIVNGSPAGVNIVKNETIDRAQVKVAIGTWDYKKYGGTKDSPVHINTTDASTFVDYYTDPSTIANGDVIIYNDGYTINNGEKVAATTTGWIEYVIPLEYRNLNAYPTHIVVSCAASQYGDYFTGYDKTKLWVDAVELIYE